MSDTRVYKMELTDAQVEKLRAAGYAPERAYEYDAEAAKKQRERAKAIATAKTNYLAAIDAWMAAGAPADAKPVRPALLDAK